MSVALGPSIGKLGMPSPLPPPPFPSSGSSSSASSPLHGLGAPPARTPTGSPSSVTSSALLPALGDGPSSLLAPARPLSRGLGVSGPPATAAPSPPAYLMVQVPPTAALERPFSSPAAVGTHNMPSLGGAVPQAQQGHHHAHHCKSPSRYAHGRHGNGPSQGVGQATDTSPLVDLGFQLQPPGFGNGTHAI